MPTIRVKDRGERAIRAWVSTFFSAGLSCFASAHIPTEWWGKAMIIATGTAIGSYLFSFVAKFFGEKGTASFVKGVEYHP